MDEAIPQRLQQSRPIFWPRGAFKIFDGVHGGTAISFSAPLFISYSPASFHIFLRPPTSSRFHLHFLLPSGAPTIKLDTKTPPQGFTSIMSSNLRVAARYPFEKNKLFFTK
jgi:hypothetical protein